MEHTSTPISLSPEQIRAIAQELLAIATANGAAQAASDVPAAAPKTAAAQPDGTPQALSGDARLKNQSRLLARQKIASLPEDELRHRLKPTLSGGQVNPDYDPQLLPSLINATLPLIGGDTAWEAYWGVRNG